MRDNAPHSAQEAAHTGPISSAKQMLWFSILAFVLPVIVIIGLVYYVTSGTAPSNQQANSLDVARRIQKVGSVDLVIGNVARPLMSGEEVYKAQCASCHATGVAGAPLFGDAAQWAPRLGLGLDTLAQSSIKGKNAMAPQGGGQFSDYEITRAVVYMTSQAGGTFAEPPAPAAEGASAAEAAPAATSEPAPAAETQPAPAEQPAPAAATEQPVPATDTAAVTAPAAAVVAAAAAPALSADAGKNLYDKSCVTCHAAGVAGAPKLGDKAAWAPRLAKGDDALLQSTINGLNAMPPRGASTANDDELKAAVEYMTAAVR